MTATESHCGSIFLAPPNDGMAILIFLCLVDLPLHGWYFPATNLLAENLWAAVAHMWFPGLCIGSSAIEPSYPVNSIGMFYNLEGALSEKSNKTELGGVME